MLGTVELKPASRQIWTSMALPGPLNKPPHRLPRVDDVTSANPNKKVAK